MTPRKRLLSHSRVRETSLGDRCPRSLLANVLDIDDNVIIGAPNGSAVFGGVQRCPEPLLTSAGGGTELRYIISELRVLTNKVLFLFIAPCWSGRPGVNLKQTNERTNKNNDLQ